MRFNLSVPRILLVALILFVLAAGAKAQDAPELKTLVMEHAGAERKMSLEDYVKVVEKLLEIVRTNM